jgi:peptidoglycan/xylan/chitin deacetylase (PgdA/CDA1 family)
VPRLDRLVTLYLFYPLRHHPITGESGIPILMYHSVSDARERRTHPYYWTATTPAVFADHMRHLHEHNYKTISLLEAVNRIGTSSAKQEEAVVLTFDDGYQDFYTQAYPILNRYGFSATVFLPTAYIGENPQSFKGTNCLTWNQVKELNRIGIHFGSHTVTHPQLRTLRPEAVRDEVQRSKGTIEEKLGSPVGTFAYPYALPETDRSFRASLRRILEEAGYQAGVSTIIGTADRTGDRFFMKRLPANSADDHRLFEAKLAGAYDWLQSLQYAWKLPTARF